MSDKLDKILKNIDSFGYSSENFGLTESPAGLPSPTNYTINPAIQRLTQDCSTAQLTITVAKASTGSTNTYNPVFLFGSDAYTNTSQGYTAVQVASPAQYTAAGFSNSKNTIVFTYKDPSDPTVKYSTYTVSQSTDGEYPFWLNQLTGDKSNVINAMQITVADAAHVAQLNNAIQTFELNQFGKSTSNDLTQPKDLYQQQTNGIWYTNPFEVSGKKGIKLNVNETNGMVLNLFMYVKPGKSCGC